MKEKLIFFLQIRFVWCQQNSKFIPSLFNTTVSSRVYTIQVFESRWAKCWFVLLYLVFAGAGREEFSSRHVNKLKNGVSFNYRQYVRTRALNKNYLQTSYQSYRTRQKKIQFCKWYSTTVGTEYISFEHRFEARLYLLKVK